MAKIKKSERFLTPADLKPIVYLAGCYHFQKPIWFEYRESSHHFILVQSGTLEARTIDGELSAGPHDLVYFRPASRNQYGVTAGTTYFQASLAFAPPPRGLWSLRIEPIGKLPRLLSLGEHFEEMRVLFETLCLELGEWGDFNELRVTGTIYQFLALIVQIASGGDTKHNRRFDKWQRIRLRLEENLSANIKIRGLAREVGLCTDHFIRQFKARFVLSPMAYRTRARIREAVRLLRETNLEIKQIAAKLGWCDTNVLASHMQQILGYSASAIRSGKPVDDLKLPGGKLYPVNLHVVPPKAGPDYFDRWMLPSRRDVITQATITKMSSSRKK